MNHCGWDKAHPPAVIVNINAAVQPVRATQVAAAQIVTHDHIIVRLVVEVTPRIDNLAVGVQHRAVEHIKHMCAHDGGVFAVVCKRHHAQDGLRLNNHVIVQQQHIVAAVIHGLKHATGETARTAQVTLINNAEFTGERLNNFLKIGVVLHLFISLINDQELVHRIKNLGAFTQCANIVNAVLNLVHGSDLHGCLASVYISARLNITQPVSLNQLKVGGARKIKPVPSAVAKWG